MDSSEINIIMYPKPFFKTKRRGQPGHVFIL